MSSIHGESDPSELLESVSHLWNYSFNYINSMSLKCAVDLGIPDIIHKHGRPIALSQLTSALPIHSTKSQYVSRLMNLLVHSGFFQIHNINGGNSEEAYSLTQASTLLVKDSPFCATPFVYMALDSTQMKLWTNLSAWFQNDDATPFKTELGEEFYQKSRNDTRLDDLLNECTASDSKLVSKVVISKCREVFEGLKSLVDVGGGKGIMSRTIADAFPDLNCTVLDQPHVVAGLEGKNNLKYVGGDMFESIPPADAALMKWVMVDWNDESCIKILKRCKEAITSEGRRGGKLIIIETVMGHKKWNDKDSIETQLLLDNTVMANMGGKQRTETEWEKLFIDAGFKSYKIYPILGIRALIEVFA